MKWWVETTDTRGRSSRTWTSLMTVLLLVRIP